LPNLACGFCGEVHDAALRSVIREDGFLRDWLRYCEPFEYPERFAIFALLVMASCALDGRILINPGSKPETWTNIYCLLYGPSGSRKSEALFDALGLLGEAIPEAPVLPMNFTMEALRGRLSEDSDTIGRAAGLIFTEELSTLLGGRDYLLNNSLFLSKVWEGRPRETFLTIAHQEQIIKNAYIVIGGCSTPEAFEDLDPKGLSTGFLRRIMFVVAHGRKHGNAAPLVNSTFRNTILVPRFRDRLGPQRIKQGVMRLSKEAAEVNVEWYQKDVTALLKKHAGPRETHFINTLQVHAFKIGTLVHLLEGGDPEWLSAEGLDTGIRLTKLLLPGTFEAYASLVPTPFAKLRAIVLRVAGAAPVPLTPAKLDQAVWKESGCSPDQANQARLSLMIDGGLVTTPDGRVTVNR
jgi:hypothetical protein